MVPTPRRGEPWLPAPTQPPAERREGRDEAKLSSLALSLTHHCKPFPHPVLSGRSAGKPGAVGLDTRAGSVAT